MPFFSARASRACKAYTPSDKQQNLENIESCDFSVYDSFVLGINGLG